MGAGASSSVLANAVINITGNLEGLRHAMRETQTQLYGMMTIANRVGGGIVQGLFSPLASHVGMHAIDKAMQASEQRYRQDLAAWTALSRGQRGPKPNLSDPVYQAPIQAAGLLAGKAVMATGAVIGLGVALAKTVDLASDLKEQAMKTEQVFGVFTSKMIKGSEEAAKGWAVTRAEFLKITSTFGIMLQGAGFSEETSSGMSVKLAKLAADAANFYNEADASVSLHKIQSALAGMNRPLREYGVIISADEVKHRAYQMHLAKTGEELSENAKIAARYELVMEGLRRAMGDTERSQNRWAFQKKQLGVNLSEMGTSIGERVEPAGSYALAWINKAMMNVAGLAESLASKFDGISDVGKSGETLRKEDWDRRMNQKAISKRNAELIAAERADAESGKQRRGSFTNLGDFYKHLQSSDLGGAGDTQNKMLAEQKKANGHLAKIAARGIFG
jgi:hypothetical protein